MDSDQYKAAALNHTASQVIRELENEVRFLKEALEIEKDSSDFWCDVACSLTRKLYGHG